MTNNDSLVTISAFARLVGMTPSALRFYDDCQLLDPVEVDDRTGYRYYTAEQERRAVLIRRLREIDLPLAQVREVLDGDASTAREILERHLGTLTGRASQAETVVADVLAARETPATTTTARLGGPELASAVRQVAPAVSQTGEIPALSGILAEIEGDTLTLVATDRHWMARRTLPLAHSEGPNRRLLMPATDLTEVARWAARHTVVELTADGDRARLSADGQTHEIALADDTFPSYRGIIDDQPPATARTIVERTALQEAVLAVLGLGDIRLVLGDDHLDVGVADERHGTRLPAIGWGEPMAVTFAPSLLARALAGSVGPDVLLELSAPERAVVVRSADQGSFTTLVMPTV